jgi:NADH oxidoreductase Hcr
VLIMTTPTTAWRGQASLKCLARSEETVDCASFIFAAPEACSVDFLPGQFVCLGASIGGQLKMRAYSIASDVADRQHFRVAVRRVPGGLISNWLLDHVQPGVCVEALAPAGEFHLDPARHLAADAPRHIALFSAGCGITPMMSMTFWLLDKVPGAHIHFFHSARDEASLIFAGETSRLAREHANFHLYRFLSRPQRPQECFSRRVDSGAVCRLLPAGEAVEAYLCGPQAYMDQLGEALRAHGIPASSIHSESFFTPEVGEGQGAGCAEASTHAINLPDFGRELQITGEELLLDALEREGLPIIGACRSGVCGSCRCKVLDGQAQSSTSGPLSPADIEAGYVLACSTLAQGDLKLSLG